MSKSDMYEELVSDVQNLVVGGETTATAIVLIAYSDDDVDPGILLRWVLRHWGTEAALEAWGQHQRTKAKASATRFADLGNIIANMPASAVVAKSVPQFTPWHRWIRENCWDDEHLREQALTFAQTELRRRRLLLNEERSADIHAPNQ